MRQITFNRRAFVAPATTGKAITHYMGEVLSLAEHARLQRFRRGFAASCRGPFVPFGTVDGLIARGCLFYTPEANFAHVTRTGLAALAKWRAAQPDLAGLDLLAAL